MLSKNDIDSFRFLYTMATQNIISPKIVSSGSGYVAKTDIVNVDNITFTGTLSGPMGPITGGGTGIIAHGTTGCTIAQGPNTSTVNIVGPSGLTNNGIVMISPITNNYGVCIYSSTQAASGATSSLIKVSAGGMSGLFDNSQNPINFNYAVLKL